MMPAAAPLILSSQGHDAAPNSKSLGLSPALTSPAHHSCGSGPWQPQGEVLRTRTETATSQPLTVEAFQCGCGFLAVSPWLTLALLVFPGGRREGGQRRKAEEAERQQRGSSEPGGNVME